MKKIYAIILICFSHAIAEAQSPTWAHDIAPILYQHCTTCHHPGGAGHGSLMTYSDGLLASINLQYQVDSKLMPPWPPDRNYKHYANERYLTSAQISLIDQWVNAGAPSGDTTQAPTPPVYHNSDVISSPDFSAQIPQFTVFSNNDLYQCFVLHTNLAQDEYITGIEVIPGNGSIVHHVLVYQDTTGQAQQLDQSDSHTGYTSFGGIGTSSPMLVGGWVPGSQPTFFPNGMGIRLYSGADIVLQIHYPQNSLNGIDSTKINLKLSTSASREIFANPALHYYGSGNGTLIDGPLAIPANTVKTFTERYNNTQAKVSLLSVAPHMHLIAKSIVSYAVSPANDTLPLIRINNWDFNWQGLYTFQQLQIVPTGYKIYATAVYDNTGNNANNPNRQNPLNVTAGESTTDEMMMVFFWYMLYQSGDETFVVDSTDYTDTTTLGITYNDLISTIQFYEPYPNPANDLVHLKFYLPNSADIGFQVFDMTGKLLYEEKQKTFRSGMNDTQISLNNLASGTYQIVLQSGNDKRSKPLVVSK